MYMSDNKDSDEREQIGKNDGKKGLMLQKN